MDMQSLIPRLLITLFLVAAAVPLVALNDGSAAHDKQQAQSQAPANATATKFRKVRKPVQGQYIVVLKDDTRPEDVDFVANQLLVRHQGTTRAVYRHTIKGFSIQMPEAAAIALSQEPAVEYVEEDGVVSASSTQANATWGLDRIDQRDLPRNSTYNFSNVTTGAGVHVYILDSGINILHQEFRNANGSTRASQDASFWFVGGNDCAQHGTPWPP
jgi:subtilisin family serine protease